MTWGDFWAELALSESAFSGSALNRLGEIGEELVGQFLGGAIDQRLPELGQLADDLGLDIVAQKRPAILLGQPHRGAALGETGDPALALARDLVAIGRIEIAQGDLALEAGGDRADLHFGGGTKTAVVGFLQFLPAGDAALQHSPTAHLTPPPPPPPPKP